MSKKYAIAVATVLVLAAVNLCEVRSSEAMVSFPAPQLFRWDAGCPAFAGAFGVFEW